ncbi:MAG: divalent-cation tolerance protein CutA [Zoogloeaceae bacterium]|jgi:periplasmic divalent cation tolerance protein|nr:divalent-cation tolerance protein CutA [Zoogloeaceae bacterium]
MSADTLLVITTFPDMKSAERAARALVEQGIAACVNVLTACHSVYRWQGKVETAMEIPLLIKTTRPRYAAVETRIRALHPYELPEIIALPLTAGLPAYLEWIKKETEPPCVVC